MRWFWSRGVSGGTRSGRHPTRTHLQLRHEARLLRDQIRVVLGLLLLRGVASPVGLVQPTHTDSEVGSLRRRLPPAPESEGPLSHARFHRDFRRAYARRPLTVQDSGVSLLHC